ncbi:GTP cyclohydrolase FolE2 [Agaribacterium haliotis]|uniref:GTP cyclohydrolase FolE2 n=1 Tax=Agaribacterium haliotis TaxID=2013869 RepID=UPI0018641755|nr:GTP cyclohydrolase FolE2 [Agaribacterium haliotis]
MRALPDITSDLSAETPMSLQWVGMEDIAVPICLTFQGVRQQHIAAKSKLYVSLEKTDAKGIHMSRLHHALNQLADCELDKQAMKNLLAEMIVSQAGIGHSARAELSFDVLLKKPSLLSGEAGFQSYPVCIKAEQTPRGFSTELELSIPYSSTCPCSASLARQLYADAIDQQFSANHIDKAALLQWLQSPGASIATPHSQRSYAYIRLSLGDEAWPDIAALIFQFESVIATPVQTAVKRVDEQAFAKLNAENLMFCEDAARRIKAKLGSLVYVKDYWFKVEHQESLHAHNAVVVDRKTP